MGIGLAAVNIAVQGEDSGRKPATKKGDTLGETCKRVSVGNTNPPTGTSVNGDKMSNPRFGRFLPDVQCKTYSHDAWISILSSDVAQYQLGRFRIVSDVGYALMCKRKECSFNVFRLSNAAKLSRATINRIEGSDCIIDASAKSVDGPSLAKVQQYLLGLPERTRVLRLLLTPLTDDRLGKTSFSYRAEYDPREFAADLVRGLRQAAGLSQATLASRMRTSRLMCNDPNTDLSACAAAPPPAAPMISRIENREQERGARIGTLYNIAFACGFALSVSFDGVDADTDVAAA